MPPTPLHEARHHIFRRDGDLVPRVAARVLNAMIPAPGQPSDVEVLSNDLTETDPMERRPDSVLQVPYLVKGSAGKYIAVIESQTDPREEKRRRWPHYVAHLNDKYDCPVILLVICSKRSTARQAREPIETGLPGLPCQVTRPAAIGPDNMPAITDPAEATADLGMAVLSALTHSQGRAARGILEALAEALSTIDEEPARDLAEFTATGLNGTAGKEIWRHLMATRTYPFSTPIRQEYIEAGKTEGRAEGLVQGERGTVRMVLQARGLQLSEAHDKLIDDCDDLDTLKHWSQAALTAKNPDEVFR